jgi:NADP-dependent 3-hydroxy acid dehydrogenase YdfG
MISKGEGAVVTCAASVIGEAIATAFIEAALLCNLSAKNAALHFEALDRD